MKLSKRLSPLFIMTLGLLGIVVCIVGIAGTGFVGFRLSRTSDRVFDGVDKSLVVVRDRVVSTQRRVQEMKITTEDIGQGLKNWAQVVVFLIMVWMAVGQGCLCRHGWEASRRIRAEI